MSGQIYLIQLKDTNYFKIGITKRNPEKRLKEHQTSNAGELILLKTITVNNPTIVESSLKRQYEIYHKKGEWFESIKTENFEEQVKKLDKSISYLKENTTLKSLF